MQSFTKALTTAIATLLCALPAFAARIPALTSPVVDTAHIIDAATRAELAQQLTAISAQTGVQIAVLTVPTLDGESIEAYSMAVAEQWQLGERGKDNGVLLTVAVAEHELRIETGYGVEATLTDARCGSIIRNYITPQFKRGNYSVGIASGVQAIVGVLVGDKKTVNELTQAAQEDEEASEPIGLTLFALFLTVIILLSLFSRKRRRGLYMPTTFYTGRHDPFSDFSGGSHHSSGGFRGGGGSFGGGGASGKW